MRPRPSIKHWGIAIFPEYVRILLKAISSKQYAADECLNAVDGHVTQRAIVNKESDWPGSEKHLILRQHYFKKACSL